jgi:hypothetical protein
MSIENAAIDMGESEHIILYYTSASNNMTLERGDTLFVWRGV